MMFKCWLFLGIASCLAMNPSLCGAEEKQIEVLVIDGFSNHDWQRTTTSICTILQKHPGIEVTVSTYPQDTKTRASWMPNFEHADVVIQTCNDIGGGPRWPRRVEQGLEKFVRDGGGLFIFHSANNAFAHWDAYNQMIGLGWRDRNFGESITLNENGVIQRIPVGQGEGTSHGARHDALITRVGEHPIHAGLPRQWVAAAVELYRYARGPAQNLSVLSYAAEPKMKQNVPVEWTVHYHAGRIYNSTLGHLWHDQKAPAGIRCAGFQTLLPRVIKWLAQREITPIVPVDFPTAQHASYRELPTHHDSPATR